MAALACTVGPSVETTPPTDLALCAPWSTFGLPVEPLDRVVACDPRHLAVHLPPGSSAARAPGWRLAIRTAGWTEDVDTSAPGLVNVRYSDGDQILDLSLIDDRARTVVVLTAVAR